MGGVFANGLEISGKAVSAKTIAAFPDTCFTPPENPATPPGVPVPYPSFGMAGDTDEGTGIVKIGGETVNIKNKSHLTKTSGTEAGAAAKKGLITSKNTGRGQFESWSNNVRFDGEPVIRNTDLATHNHASPGSNTPPQIHMAALKMSNADCESFNEEWMTTYRPQRCPKGYEPHHIVDNCSFVRRGWRSKLKRQFLKKDIKSVALSGGWKTLKNMFLGKSPHPGRKYHEDKAPCICLEDSQSDGAGHRAAHDTTRLEADARAVDGIWTYKDAREAGIASMQELGEFDEHQLKCIALALKNYFEDELGCSDTTELVAPPGSHPTRSLATGGGRNAQISPPPRIRAR